MFTLSDSRMRLLLDSVRTAKWIGDCFIYTNAANRLNYFVGAESYTITPLDTCVFHRYFSLRNVTLTLP